MNRHNYDLVRQAIIEKKQVHATYGGHHREMCPHVIGTKAGSTQAQALFYQFGGTSQSGLKPEGNWRCIPISGLSNVEVHDGEWHTGYSHSRPQTCVDIIDVAVDHR